MCKQATSQNKSDYTDVLFLGAGAVSGLNLPTMKDLIEVLQVYLRENNKGKIAEKFSEKYENIKQELYGRLGLNETGIKVTKENLELLMTNIDLLIMGKNTTKYSVIDREYVDFRSECIRVLDEFFCWKAYEYVNESSPSKFFQRLVQSSSTIITTNWDTMLEAQLFIDNKKEPNIFYDLYGVTFNIEDPSFEKIMQKTGQHKQSKKINHGHRIFKLHGSAGWCSNDDQVLIPSRYMQSSGLFGLSGPAINPSTENLVLLPSYIKILNSNIISKIWVQATESLQKAKSVKIVGYSLPEADQAVRVLLQNLKLGAKKITVVDIDEKVGERWLDFFGDIKINFILESAEDHFRNKT